MAFTQILNSGSFGAVEKNTNPIDIFSELKRQPGYGYLRTNQERFLLEWNQRRDEKRLGGFIGDWIWENTDRVIGVDVKNEGV